MAGVPINFAVPSENVLASYNWTDIADGTGTIVYYGVQNTLQTIQFPQGGGGSGTITQKGSATKVIDVDYDLNFAYPKRVKGRFTTLLSWGNSGDSSHSAGYAYAIVRVRRWDGATETELASVQGTTRNFSANALFYSSEQLNIDLPLINFKKNEYLRITVEIWGDLSSSVSCDVSFNSDPLNTPASGYDWTYLKFFVPYNIDI